MPDLGNPTTNWSLYRRTKRRLAAAAARFRSNERGSVSLEFVGATLFLIPLWAGLISIVDTETTSTRIGKVTATVGDIISQSEVVNNEMIEAAFDAANAMMPTRQAEEMEMFVGGFEIVPQDSGDEGFDPDNVEYEFRTVWVCGRNYEKPGDLNNAVERFKVPSDLLQAPGYVVATHAKLRHAAIFSENFTGPRTYEYRNFFVPRGDLDTVKEDGACAAAEDDD